MGTVAFLISTAQGIFLLSLLPFLKGKNRYALIFIGLILFSLVVTNLEYLLLASGMYEHFPYPFGMSFGLMLTMGPLLFFYTQSVLDKEFRFTSRLPLHFIPYLLNLLLNIPLLLMRAEEKIAFIQVFLFGKLRFGAFDIALISFQSLHLAIYLFLILRLLHKNELTVSVPVEVGVDQRLQWLRWLHRVFAVFLFSIIGLLCYVIWLGVYDRTVNYAYTLVLSAILFLISYMFVLNRGVIDPDFALRYRKLKLDEQQKSKHAQNLLTLMETERPFLNPGLSVEELARQMGIPAHVLSKVINEELGGNFFEFVSHYRVEEVKQRFSDPACSRFSILAIATDAGFNSKSAFNSTFKKLTGQTPSAYRKQLPQAT